ncbi:hypothetical protein MTO96_000841 [Rhipicephalus appendiculatus]
MRSVDAPWNAAATDFRSSMSTSSSNVPTQATASVSKSTRTPNVPDKPPSRPGLDSGSKKQESPPPPPASRATNTQSAFQRHSLQPSDGTRDCKRVAIFLTSSIFITAAAAVAVRLQQCRFTSCAYGKDKARNRNTEALLQMVWASSNASLDPCQDFYWYACYNFELRWSTSFFRFIHSPAVTTQGLSQNEAGRALFAYFASCISAQWVPDNNVQNAVHAALEMLNVGEAATSLRMFVSIMKLNLLYGVYTDPIVYLNAHGVFPTEIDRELLPKPKGNGMRRLYVIASQENSCGLKLSSPGLTALYDAAVAEIAAAIKINITFRQLLEFANYLCSVSDNGTYTVAEADALGSFIPDVSARLWKSVVHDMTEKRPYTFRLIHSSRSALEHRLRALTNRSFQPVPAVLLVSNAVARLIRENTAIWEWGE